MWEKATSHSDTVGACKLHENKASLLELNLQPSCFDAAVQNRSHQRVDPCIQVLLTGLGVDVRPQDVPAGEVRQRETFGNPRRHRSFARAGRAHDDRAKDLVHRRHPFSRSL